MKNNLK